MSRRAKGDGGLSWDAARERWVASATMGYDGRGKRIVRRGRGRTKTEAKNKLRQLLRDMEDGLVVANDGYTVAQAVEDWLTYGLSNRDSATQEVNRRRCEKHVIPLLGARKLRDLKATEVDDWADGAFDHVEHAHASGDSLMSEPCRKAGSGAGSSSAERCGVD